MIKQFFIAAGILIVGGLLYIWYWNAKPMPSPDPTPVYVQQPLNESVLYEKINQYRVSQGLTPLRFDPSMCEFAKTRLSQIHTDWSHNQWLAGVKNAYYYQYAGENLARGQQSEDQTLQDWIGSPTHKAGMIDPHFNRTCIESDTDGSSTYTVQQFAD